MVGVGEFAESEGSEERGACSDHEERALAEVAGSEMGQPSQE